MQTDGRSGRYVRGLLNYKVLYAIRRLRGNQKLATAVRIQEILDIPHARVDLRQYWLWNQVIRKDIKNSSNKRRKVDRSQHHWDLSKAGERRFLYLQDKFGEITEVLNEKASKLLSPEQK